MALTDFGRAVRIARLTTDETLLSMSDALGCTPSFLSAIETGKKKVPMSLVESIESFFKKKNYLFPQNLRDLAAVSNKEVSVEGLSLQQQMLVAGFARSPMNAEQLERLAELLGVGKK
ncbi:XRE family transcriptional regulator [Rhodoferax mekongensis]|uniref:XRE family transcriptional regulator n=1 Tax=Rhodoferax mekongensis TaxID=3068341 RepID=UPI0028BDCE6E|nr:XRE family transcriptional regulator [Rhodoferax sp. TBRC 17199]MDT7514692.1 XRE family transcriptional regulator [Rhodoferax sp. TBRC 17199]